MTSPHPSAMPPISNAISTFSAIIRPPAQSLSDPQNAPPLAFSLPRDNRPARPGHRDTAPDDTHLDTSLAHAGARIRWLSGASAAPGLVARAMAATEDAGFGQVLDGRFRGGTITRHYGSPAQGMHAIQLELAQACYLDEASPTLWDGNRAAPLIAALVSPARELLRA